MLFPVKLKVALVGLVVAGGAAAALALGPAGLAEGQPAASTARSTSPVQAEVTATSPATLVPGGAEVDVTVTASCLGPDIASAAVQVTVTENVNGDLANGYGSTTVNCTGTPQTADIVVVAYTSSPVGAPTSVPYQDFTQGRAIADTAIEACDYTYSCTVQEIYPVIRIGK